MKKETTRRLTTSAVMIAISTVISWVCGFIPFLNLPFGGSITIASMLPIVLISYMYGMKWGFFSAFTYSVIQMLLGHGTVAALFTPNDDAYMGLAKGLLICFIDYVLAYTSLGLGGIFRNKIKNKGVSLCVGSIVALFVCYAFHILSGAIFYGAFAEWFFTDTVLADLAISKWIMNNIGGAMLSFVYSLIYNGCYMIPEIVLTAVLAFPIARIPVVSKRDI